ncbi:hypothetical protein LJC34_01360, partial [Oscillospiraceae bacterium OttesenSCG-928-G22]|nr:hypothetical protein [Oscillospiraceae bacterium OttesenSCG-928-G22]
MRKTGKDRLISLMLTICMVLGLIPALAPTAQAAANTYHLLTQSTGNPGEVTWTELASAGDKIAGLADGDIIVIDAEPPAGGATLNITAPNVTVKLGSSFSTDPIAPFTIDVADGVESLTLESVPVSGVTVNFKAATPTLTVIGHIALTQLTGVGDTAVVGHGGSSLTIEEAAVTGELLVGVPVEVKGLSANTKVKFTAFFPASLTATLQTDTTLATLSSGLVSCKWSTTLADPTIPGASSETSFTNVSIPANIPTMFFLYNPNSPYGVDPGTYYIGVNERDAAAAASGGTALIPWSCLVTDSSGNYHIPGLASGSTLIFVSDNPDPARAFLVDADGVKVSSYGTANGYSGAYSPNHVNLLTADTVSALTLDRFTTGTVGGAKLTLQNPVKTTVTASGDSALGELTSVGALEMVGPGKLSVGGRIFYDGSRSSGGGAPAPQPQIAGGSGWTKITGKVGDMKDGDTLTIDMNGTTTVPGDFLKAIAGKDVSVTFDMGGGMSWTVNGSDIPAGAQSALNLGVKTGANYIPVAVRNIDGSVSEVQLRLAHDGAFGFTMVLSVKLDAKNAGHFANLYYYNAETGELEFLSAAKIASDGAVEFVFDHASDY